MSAMSSTGIFNPGGGGGITPSSADVLTNKTIDSATNTLLVNGQSAVAVLASNYTNATTSLSNVTGISFAVEANKNYFITCNLAYSVDTSTATPNWAFTGPASPTSVLLTGIQAAAAANSVLGTGAVQTAFGAATTTATTTTITTQWAAFLYLTVRNGANAGTVQLQAKANGVGTVTVLAGSMALIHQA